ncbi:MAG TPA: hypothetical protein VF251_15090, partial [Pyrinomonadaceae bacterium]
ARQLKDAADSLARDRVAERIRESKQGLGNGQQQQQANGSNERAIERSLNNVSERLQSAEQSARNSGGTSGEEALDRTRQLADNLDSLRRRLDENAGRRNANGQQDRNGQQSGQQSGQQQGQQGRQGQSGEGQTGSQQGQQQGGQQGGTQSGGSQSGSRQYGGPTWGPQGNAWGDNRQLPSEVRERLRDAEDLRRQWRGGTTMGPVRQLDEVIERLKQLADGRMEGDAQTAAFLKSEVIEPLRQLELEISRQLQLQSGRTNLRLRDEGAAPERYRRAVEEYYRRLSGARPKQ